MHSPMDDKIKRNVIRRMISEYLRETELSITNNREKY